MAEGRQVSNVPEVIRNLLERAKTSVHGEPKIKLPSSIGYEAIMKWVCRTKQRVYYNGLWPTTWYNLLGGWIVFALILIIDHPKLNYVSQYLYRFGEHYLYLTDSTAYVPRVFLVSFASSIVYFVFVMRTRQYLLRLLLSYKGWLYQPPRSQSKVVLLWGLLVRIVSGRKPRMYSYQNSLPRMKVPPLKSTMNKLLDSLKPILDKDEYQKIEEEAKTFFTNDGPKLQWILRLKSWWAPNYCTDWWERYVYLMSREPIAINSNYAVLDSQHFCPTRKQAARAAGVTTIILFFKSQMDSERFQPLVARNTIPFCMSQYERLFGTVRIPGTEVDELIHNRASKHIVVLAKGYFYTVYVADENGKRLNVLDLQTQFEWILNDAEAMTAQTEAELHVAALTAGERTTWANIRREHFTDGLNKESLKAIEESILLLVLDDSEYDDPSERSKYYLNGNGSSIWFDKSITAIVMKDGKFGMNIEHSWADGPVAGSLMEYIAITEYNFKIYDDKGDCKPFLSPHNLTTKFRFQRSKALITPKRLCWDINADLEKCICEARTFAVKNNSDLEVCVRHHDAFSKGFIKTTKNSPDAFVQLALQLAYYKDSEGSFALTYESSMTRLFLHGRTETVRSLTQEVQEYVRAMCDPHLPAKEKIRLMKVAADKHSDNYRDCMAGKGADRHIFALYVACKWRGYDSAFLKSILTMPWTLSTTQLPLWQYDPRFDFNMSEVSVLNSFGGGFGPACDNGYGCSYVIPNDTSMYFYVSAKKGCTKTDSLRFMDNIFWAMSEMKKVFEESLKPQDDSAAYQNGHVPE